MPLTDTHTHIFLPEFEQDREAVVERAVQAGVNRLLLPNINLGTLPQVFDLAESHLGICYPMVGLHPTDIEDDYRHQLEEMERILQEDADGEKRIVAIGEIGLDLYWDKSQADLQTEVFKTQLEWAVRYDLPVMIHSRSAFSYVLDIIEAFQTEGKLLKGVFHCFSATLQETARALGLSDFLFGIGGVVTYKNSGLSDLLAASVPLERLVLETDSPYLPPVPYRGQRNEPSYITKVAEKLAQIYGVTTQEVADTTTRNASKLFRI